MKKIFAILTLATIAASGFAAEKPSPALLKDKANFSKTELFEPREVFADKDANAALLRDYEANPSAYKPDQLLPVALCYLSFGDIPKAKSALESFLKVSPKNVRALRTLGTISLLSKDLDRAMLYYKGAIDGGDEKSVVFLCSAYIMTQRFDDIKPYVAKLEKMAKTNLEALNVVLFYAGRDKKSFDETLAKRVLSSIDARAVLGSATPDGMSTVFRLFMATGKIWPVSSLTVPARAAALAEMWPVALKTYKKVLAAEPNNAVALRGMGLVAYRTGDIMGAADFIMKAYKTGDKEAASDGFDLFLLSHERKVWEIFQPYIKDIKPAPQLLADCVQWSVGRDDSADVFYFGALGANADPLYKDEGVVKLLQEGAKKYASDARSAEVLKKLKANAKK